MITFQRGEEAHAADAELDAERFEVLRLDDPHGKPGRAARDVGLLDDGDFRLPEFGQVQRRREADGPPSDDADRRPDHLDYASGPTQKPSRAYQASTLEGTQSRRCRRIIALSSASRRRG